MTRDLADNTGNAINPVRKMALQASCSQVTTAQVFKKNFFSLNGNRYSTNSVTETYYTNGVESLKRLPEQVSRSQALASHGNIRFPPKLIFAFIKIIHSHCIRPSRRIRKGL